MVIPANSAHNNSEAPPFDVCVVGLGYVGLPTAAVLATLGNRVAGIDTREDVIARIGRGEVHIVEPELDALVRAAVAQGTLQAIGPKPVPADVFLLCVPTPLGAGNAPDLSYVKAATHAIVPALRPGNLVVLESTSPPTTTRLIVAEILAEHGFVAGETIFVAHAPERVLPGAVIREVVENARVVGGVTEACTSRAVSFYESFVRGDVHPATADVAELVKLSENAFRDLNIGFANELANICEHLGLDPWSVIKLANHHPRVQILRPGPGVGGHCIAVDPWFIVAAAPEHTPLIQAARQVNDARPLAVVEAVARQAKRYRGARVACLGLSYKPDIDDLRESPAVEVVEALHKRPEVAELMVVEPHLENSPFADIRLWTLDSALERADIVVILVAHRIFRQRIAPQRLLGHTVIDPVGLLQPG
ncbi:MAG: UDP-N-acetyl-D-mannosamine dehydrogenase [Nannocystaceae bacterium]